MLPILSATALAKRISDTRDGLSLLDLPRFTADELGLHGLMLPTNLLAGADLARLDRIRDMADKARCPCLVLVESEPQPLGRADDEAAEVAVERMRRVVSAAHRLGCNAAAMTIDAPDSEEAMSDVADNIRHILERADRLEINVLIAPGKGLTQPPDNIPALIKQVGGFRIGSMPDFEVAAKSGDPTEYLRRVAPYASAAIASSTVFDASGAHKPFDLLACLHAAQEVGFDGALALEYRGKGDPVEGLIKTRDAILAIDEPDLDDEDLDDDVVSAEADSDEDSGE